MRHLGRSSCLSYIIYINWGLLSNIDKYLSSNIFIIRIIKENKNLMEIVNRRKRNGGSGHGRTTSFSDKKVKYNLNIDVLNWMCSYIISSNSNIKKSHNK